ncbi:hypothetical protein Tco_1125667 [Tanacetum coccineum]|uniref:Uncharacterized protein n=1 Tax=Tanacetum coccineum TaxID=301880 RepID=A0ABQ5J9M5_9ASTR
MKKMNEKPGHVRPANGFYEKLNALMFVPQQELSREQAYWLPANERASQTSNPNSPVTPFVRKSRPPSQVLASLRNVNAVFPQFEGIIKERTTQKPDYVSEWCFDYAKQFVEQQLVPFYDHFKKHIQAANETFFKEIREFEQIFDELEAEYEQCVLDNKNLTIEKKNLLIKNDCLIAECLEKDICSIVLTSDIVVPPSSNCLCEDLRSACDREHTKVLELEAEVLKQQKMVIESEKRNSHLQKTHIDLQLKFQNYKQCIDTSSASNAIFEINKLRKQLQGKDDTIRNLDAQINIMKVLKVGSTEGSCDQQALDTDRIQLQDMITSLRIQLDGLKVENVSLKRRYDELSQANTHSRTAYTEKLSALTAENTKLKAQVTGKTSSGPSTSETPKVLAPGMYNLGSKYIPPPKRANWVKPTPLPKKKQVTFSEPPRPSLKPTQKPVVHPNKQTNVCVPMSTGVKPTSGASKTVPKRAPRNHSSLPVKSANARRAAIHNRNLNFDHNQFVIRSLKSVNTKTPQAKHNGNHTKKVWKATRKHNVNTTNTGMETKKDSGTVRPVKRLLFLNLIAAEIEHELPLTSSRQIAVSFLSGSNESKTVSIERGVKLASVRTSGVIVIDTRGKQGSNDTSDDRTSGKQGRSNEWKRSGTRTSGSLWIEQATEQGVTDTGDSQQAIERSTKKKQNAAGTDSRPQCWSENDYNHGDVVHTQVQIECKTQWQGKLDSELNDEEYSCEMADTQAENHPPVKLIARSRYYTHLKAYDAHAKKDSQETGAVYKLLIFLSGFQKRISTTNNQLHDFLQLKDVIATGAMMFTFVTEPTHRKALQRQGKVIFTTAEEKNMLRGKFKSEDATRKNILDSDPRLRLIDKTSPDHQYLFLTPSPKWFQLRSDLQTHLIKFRMIAILTGLAKPTETGTLLRNQKWQPAELATRTILGTREPRSRLYGQAGQPGVLRADTLLHLTHQPVVVYGIVEESCFQQVELSREQAYWLPANERLLVKLVTQIVLSRPLCRKSRRSKSSSDQSNSEMLRRFFLEFEEKKNHLIKNVNAVDLLAGVLKKDICALEVALTMPDSGVDAASDVKSLSRDLSLDLQCAIVSSDGVGGGGHLGSQSTQQATFSDKTDRYSSESIHGIRSSGFSLYGLKRKLSALNCKKYQAESQVTGKTSSGPSTSEKPKVLASGIYNVGSKSKGRTVADSFAARLTRLTAYKFKTDCSIIPVCLGVENATEIVARRANECIVSITEPDYKNLNKNDIEDMYLLIMNGKVPDYAKTGLVWSLSVFIRSSVIWERMHDFQLGIESYQHKVNLNAPTISFPGVEKYRMFSIIYEPVHGIIYKNSKKDKRVMRHSEIHKFCDATLNRVLEGLKSYNNDVKYGYVQRELTNNKVEYLKLFEEEIEVRLKHRNQMRR